MILVKIRRHLRHTGIVVVSVPEDGNALMGRFGPARLSPSDRGYLVPDEQVDALLRFLARHDVRVLDERDAPVTDTAPAKYDPLPECSSCGVPVARRLVDDLRDCPHCGIPWRPYRFDLDPLMRPTDTADDAPAALGHARFLEARAQFARLPKPDVAAVAAARAVRCPWCHASPGTPCTVAGTGRPLTITAAHPSRHTSAGVGPPPILTDDLTARRDLLRAAGDA